MVVVWKNPTPVLDGSFRASCAGILERQRYNTVVLASETACGAQEARVRGEVLGSRPNTLNSRPRQALFLGRLPPGAATIYTQTVCGLASLAAWHTNRLGRRRPPSANAKLSNSRN